MTTKFVKNKICQAILTSSTLVAVSLSSFSFANELEETEIIEVRGIRASLIKAMDVKRSADSVVDAITAEDIGKFPDQNVAESLQRISGVTIDRSNGEGTGVTVRGFGPAFNAVRYNNRLIATTNTGRDFDFQVLAPELISGVQIHKSPTADLVEGGIGSTINMEGARPLSNPGTTLVGSAKMTQQSISEQWSPRLSGLFSTTFNDDTMGLLFAAAYDDRETRIDRLDIQAGAYAYRKVDSDGVDGKDLFGRHPGKPNFTAEVENRERLSLAGTFQWRPTADHTITFDTMLIDFGNFQTRYGVQFSPEGGTVRLNPVLDDNGTFVKFNAPNNPNDVEVRPFQDDTETTMFGLNWQGTLSDQLSVELDIAYSEAENVNRKDQLTPGAFFEYTLDSTTGNTIPDIQTPGTNLEDPSLFQAHFVGLREQQRDDSVFELRFDVDYAVDMGMFESVQAGVYQSEREKSQLALSNQPTWCRLGCSRNTSKVDLPNSLFKPFPFDNYMEQEPGNFPRAWVTFDPNEFLALATNIDPEIANLAQSDRESFETKEDSTSLYARANFSGDLGTQAWSANIGLRYVSLERTTSGTAQDLVFNSSTIENPGGANLNFIGEKESLSVSKDFSTVLPSLNIRYDVTDDLVARFAASKVMTAPGMFASSVQSSVNGNFENFSISGSNPHLEPFQANQVDLSLEYYGENGNGASVGLFSKDITTGITQVSTNLDTGYDVPGLGRLLAIDNRFQNNDGGKITGLELAGLYNFAGMLDGYGIQANYTYADSSSGDNTTETDQSRLATFALPTEDGVEGFAKYSYNIIGFYEKEGFGIRLAYNWRDRFIYRANGGGNDAQYGRAYGQWDLNASYDLSEKVSMFFEGINLTDEGTIREQSFGRVFQVEYAGRRIGAGIRARF
ncbi:hypothetical protein C2869_07650 [Saccharobesus litoralis]|uniref:TonB-dependent receptor n=1 Tax=Saccharobesus litoralis TaxID=2172099 RepID=A0A2S0VQ29_9ALTE|nr:TonB-dependent receptor [Saccharobesus litoralis]AWB66314.1 hypothetical protein C2869_07650 [Saccharobesus litoralis]